MTVSLKVKPRPRSQQLAKLSLQSPNSQVPDFLMITNNEEPEGKMTRLPTRQDVDPRIAEIRETGRNAQGVKLIDLRENEILQAIAPVVSSEDEEKAEGTEPEAAS